MVKPEWGIKRHCQACAANFYDLRRSPIICPKCGDELDPEAFVRPRRSRAPVEKEAPAPAKKAAVAENGDKAKKDDKTGDKLAAAESLDDNLVTASLDENEEEKVFVPSEELEAEPDFEAEGEENGDGKTKQDKAAAEKTEEAKAKTKPVKAEPETVKAKKKPGKADKAKPAKAEPKTTKPKKATPAKKSAPKPKAETKKKAPAKAAKGKKA